MERNDYFYRLCASNNEYDFIFCVMAILWQILGKHVRILRSEAESYSFWFSFPEKSWQREISKFSKFSSFFFLNNCPFFPLSHKSGEINVNCETDSCVGFPYAFFLNRIDFGSRPRPRHPYHAILVSSNNYRFCQFSPLFLTFLQFSRTLDSLELVTMVCS